MRVHMRTSGLVGLLALMFAPWVVAQPIFESGFEAFPDVVLTKSAPEATNASVIMYTTEYAYPAESIVPAQGVVLTDAIPAGTTYVDFSATGGGIFADGTVTWNLPDLDPGD